MSLQTDRALEQQKVLLGEAPHLILGHRKSALTSDVHFLTLFCTSTESKLLDLVGACLQPGRKLRSFPDKLGKWRGSGLC